MRHRLKLKIPRVSQCCFRQLLGLRSYYPEPNQTLAHASLEWPWRDSRIALAPQQQADARVAFNTRFQALLNLAKINLAIILLTAPARSATDVAEACDYYWQVKRAIASKTYVLL